MNLFINSIGISLGIIETQVNLLYQMRQRERGREKSVPSFSAVQKLSLTMILFSKSLCTDMTRYSVLDLGELAQ